MTATLIKKLREIVGSDNVLDSHESRITYAYDATAMKPQLPAAVVRPSTAEQISQVVHIANEERFPIVPRGSGTGLSGGALPMEDSVVLLTNHWNKILEL